ncbi:MAG: hypothetical protein J6Y03_01895 [Alphaproteobacteria bacterium]|nr:hypothetical protein [Alphaproteobacteria bacterium]
MLENTNVMSVEDFMSSFGIVPMTTAKDEGLLNFDTCKQRVLDLIKLNIKNFKEDLWKKENRMLKLLVDLDDKRNKSIFTMRLGGKRIYRCNTQKLQLPEKIDFLNKFYSAVAQGMLDKHIVNFCEKEVKLAEARKEKQKEKRKAKRQAEREEQAKKEAEAKKYLPQV